jgi:Domain of unknown function (DUF4157)
MRTFAQKQNPFQQRSFFNLTRASAVEPVVIHRDDDHAEDFASTVSIPFAHDFSRITVDSLYPIMLRAKLTVNTPGDRYEQEAERVAEQVMRMPVPSLRTPPIGLHESAQQKCAAWAVRQRNDGLRETRPLNSAPNRPEPGAAHGDEKLYAKVIGEGSCVGTNNSRGGAGHCTIDTKDSGEETSGDDTEAAAPESAAETREKVSENSLQRSAVGHSPPLTASAIVGEGLDSSGHPLDTETRSFMESRFGHSFAHVRVHNNTQASLSADAVGAYAYTVGRDIVFRSGAYAPATDAGRRLLAHELTHVVQQGGTAETATGGRQQGMAISRSIRPLLQRQIKTAIRECPPSPEATTELLSHSNLMGLAWPERVSVKITARRWWDRFTSEDESESPHGAESRDKGDPQEGNDSMGRLEPVWRAHVTQVVGRYSRQVRLLPDQKEVSTDLSQTTKENFCAQVTQLSSLGNTILPNPDPSKPPEGWYMIAAVKAHENLHISRFHEALDNAVPDIKSFFTDFIEPTRVPSGKHSRKLSRAEAVGRIKKSGGFPAALWQARNAWQAQTDKLVEKDHTGPTAAAEHIVVDPIVRNICNYAKGQRRKEQGWEKCPACPP